MVAYEFYQRVPGGEDRLIGILPERRRDQKRITHESLMKWARLLVSSNMTKEFFTRNVYLMPIRWPDPIFRD